MGSEVKTGIEGELYISNSTQSFAGTIAIPGSRFGFCEGVSWSWDQDNVAVWDRGTFSHWKKGRGRGELTVPQAYVDNLDMVAYLVGTTSGSTAPRIQAELRVIGTSGAAEYTEQFTDIALKHYDKNEPEGAEKVTWNMSFDMMKAVVKGTGTGRITG